jgi:hypothetical protein
MKVESTCPKCGRIHPIEFDADGMDPTLTEAMRKFASHVTCRQCEPPPPPERPVKPRKEYRSPMADP